MRPDEGFERVRSDDYPVSVKRVEIQVTRDHNVGIPNVLQTVRLDPPYNVQDTAHRDEIMATFKTWACMMFDWPHTKDVLVFMYTE